ncbi:group II intron maturase-specific domain-containing protein [Streptomyces sp. NPDC015125]
MIHKLNPIIRGWAAYHRERVVQPHFPCP